VKKFLGVYNSSAVNRYGYKFPVETLFSALEQSWDVGVPSFISHDYHKPLGWSKGLALYIEPELTRLVGLSILPEKDEEREEILSAIRYTLTKKITKEFEPHRDKIQQLLGHQLTEKAEAHFANSAAFIEKDLAMRVFPEVFAQRDKDGLVELKSLNPIGPGVYEIDGLLLFAHQYFRRSFSRLNNLNDHFLQELQEIGDIAKELSIRISLDPDMVGLAESYLPHIELEYWRGPRFDNDLAKIPYGVTVHAAKENEKFFHDISKSEFWWHEQDDLKVLECEEVRDSCSVGTGEDTFGCRYIHCILDAATCRNPTHFDGAVRVYDFEKMLERVECDISRAGKKTDYHKLWRLDGDIDVNLWKSLMCNYFRDNTLVGEYLGGSFEISLPEQVQDKESDPLLKYVPVIMPKGCGPRLSVSIQPNITNSPSSRFIESFDSLWQDARRLNYIDANTIDVIKDIRRRGGNISIAGSYDFICFEDMVVNLPLFQHVGDDVINQAEDTFLSIKSICKACAENGDDRLVTYTIGIQYDDKNVWFSVAGHVADLVDWHDGFGKHLPHSYDAVKSWCSKAEEELGRKYSHDPETPWLHSVVKTSGILVVPRIYLQPEQYYNSFDNTTGKLIRHLLIHKDDKQLLELITSKKLKVVDSFLRKASTCSKCNEDYYIGDAKNNSPFASMRKGFLFSWGLLCPFDC